MAARATIELKNLDKVLKQLEQYGKEKDEQIDNAVGFTVKEVQNFARMHAPQKTGHLWRSIKTEWTPGSKMGRVFVSLLTVPYAMIMEFGFSGPQNVQAHVRQMSKVFGRTIPGGKKVEVSAHTRQVRRFGHYYMTFAAERGSQMFIENLKRMVT